MTGTLGKFEVREVSIPSVNACKSIDGNDSIKGGPPGKGRLREIREGVPKD